MEKKSLRSLDWVSRFLDETPGDEVIGGTSRQVPGACWSRVNPTPTSNPVLRLWSNEMADELGIEAGEDRILGGKEITKGMDPYAQQGPQTPLAVLNQYCNNLNEESQDFDDVIEKLYQTSIVESNNFTISETKAFVAVVLYFVVISMCLRLQKIIHKFSYFFE